MRFDIQTYDFIIHIIQTDFSILNFISIELEFKLYLFNL